MTRITKLELQGFKSFAKKTQILFPSNLSVIAGPNGSGKCITGDSLVTLSDGSCVRIDELVNKHEINSIKTDDGWMASGDGTKILTLSDNLKIVPRSIKAFVKRTAPESMIKIKTSSGRKLTATPYHPLFVLKEGQVEPIQAGELKAGLRIAVPRSLPVEKSEKTFIELFDAMLFHVRPGLCFLTILSICFVQEMYKPP